MYVCMYVCTYVCMYVRRRRAQDSELCTLHGLLNPIPVSSKLETRYVQMYRYARLFVNMNRPVMKVHKA